MGVARRQIRLAEKEINSLKDKAREIEKESKYTPYLSGSWGSSVPGEGMGFGDARGYENAAKLRLKVGDIGKAIKDYKKAASLYTDYMIKGNGNNTEYQEKALERCERNIERLKKVLRGKWHGLERIASIIVLITGLFFLSSNLTGNVIGNMTNSTSNWIGGVLFILGLVGALFYFKNK